ncbi:MAG: hybrid sensor histidine kinase/response regulator [Campylobacterota bacterium]|nr:hybrid sensor histidine kinase/response regulator [Campylobacterota bacterium]
MYLNNFSVMHVEDDQDIQDIVRYILEPKVKNIYFASNGKDALDIYDKHKPDIILSDINMPYMSGLDMSKKIKKKDPDIPIVLFTSFDNPDYLKEAINTGIDKYIEKPFDNNMVCNTLDCVAKSLYLNTEKKNMERMLQTQSKVAAMGEMIGNIAHQWRQPLSVISTIASAFPVKIDLGKEISQKEILDYSNKIVEQVEYLSSTIDDFKDFCNQSDKLFSSFNIKDTIDKTVNLTKDSFINNSINIVLDIDDFIFLQKENELIQVFLNIFNNAKDAFNINEIDYANRYLFVDIKKEQENCTIIIKDSAGGIVDEALQRVFEPYFTTKFEAQGTGIGLYMTHKIITEHYNGKIEAYNEQYNYNDLMLKGAVFKIIL